MTPPPIPEHLEARRRLAQLIDEALQRGQHVTTAAPEKWKRWTNARFADAVQEGLAESVVRSWRNVRNPTRPTGIVKLLNVFYGDPKNPPAGKLAREAVQAFAPARQAMLDAWRLADGYAPVEPEPPPPSTIKTMNFSEYVEIVDLGVSQPTPDNYGGNLIVPVTLRIHPDPACEFGGKSVEIGVADAYVMVESADWRPGPDSVFRGKKHPKVQGVGRSGAIRIVGNKDKKGRIDDAPLDDEPRVTMEPLRDGAAGSIDFSVRVARDAFVVSPKGGADPTDAQNTVLDAIFADGAFPRDRKGRLIVTKETVKPRVTRDPSEDPI